jgi:hypothetical protein
LKSGEVEVTFTPLGDRRTQVDLEQPEQGQASTLASERDR